MQSDDLPPEVIAAIVTLIRYAKDILRTAMADNQAGESEDEGYYDARSAPMGPTTFLRLAREGAFPATKVGRKVLARKSDVEAWIRVRSNKIPHRSTREAQEPSATPIVPDGEMDALALHEFTRQASLEARGIKPLRQVKRPKGR